MSRGLRIERRFTREGAHPFETVEWTKRDSRITNPDGSVVFEMEAAEVPAGWSQVAADIMVSKYFRKAGVPQVDVEGNPILDEEGNPVLGPERSARQVIARLASTWRWWGERHGYFATEADAQAFEDELAYMLVHQMAAPNSPQWFNTGLNHVYGITGPPQGFWYVDPETGELVPSPDSYSRPAPHACFIQSVEDDLVNPGGIMDLWVREARLFKFGSGCTSGDARIYVEGEGLLPIRDLFRRFEEQGRPVRDFDGKGRYIDIGDADVRTLSVDEETGEYRRDKVELVWRYDVDADDKVVVRFDRGTKVTVSAWHPFLVWDGERIVERRADRLRRGDAVLGPNETALAAVSTPTPVVEYETMHFGRTERHRLEIDEELAWLCGYFLGFGSLGRTSSTRTSVQGRRYRHERLRLRFHDESVEVLDRVRDIVRRHFGSTAAIREDGRGSNGKHVTYTGRRVTGFFAEIFGVGPETRRLSMPGFARSGDARLGLAFLAGLLDSDGCVSEDGTATYATPSHDFARDVAVLASFLGLGGGIVRPRTVSVVTLVHRSVGAEDRRRLARHVAHEERRRRLLSDHITRERKFCMPLSDDLVVELLGEPQRAADRLDREVGGERFHLGRLHHEGLVNPSKLERMVAVIDHDERWERLARIARSLVFVTSVEAATDDPDFYDLTVAEHSNYLAGETGLVAIHNTGTNFSKIRAEGEPLSGGGKSSGLMSFLKVGDRAAGAIKSGGTTRRAAKMVILDVDHPDIEAFVEWKVREEDKVRALVAAGYPSDFNGEAYATVSGQNSNNSVRVSNEFLQAVLEDGEWELTARTDGSVMRTVRARDLWRKIAEAAWAVADPGVQFHTTINEWHTCPEGGEIRATNPCFTGDTRIATDKGLLRFDELVRRAADGETFEVYTHDATHPDAPAEAIRLSRPTQIMVTGTNPVLRLEFSDGRVVRCTPNHRFFTVDRGWVRADELTDDDEVRLLDRDIDFGMASWAIPVSTDPRTYEARPSRRYTVQLLEKWTEDLAHYLGWLVGDGCLTDDAAVTVYRTEAEQRSAMVLHRELVASLNGGVAPEPAQTANGTRQLRVTRGAVRGFLEALGIGDGGAATKRVPWAIFQAPKPVVAAFLRGLYDADGCVRYGEDTRYVGLASTSRELLQDVQVLLDTFGVHATICGTGRPGTSSFSYTTRDGDHRRYESEPVYDLRITGPSLERFHRKIGFELSHKGDILEEMLRTTGRYATRYRVRLRSRVEDGFETTYNLTEPVNHSYVANGCLVSNCSEYVFLDNTACNLASLNLGKFYDDETGIFDVDAYEHAIRLWTIVLEISVTMAHFPSKEIAQGSYDYRTLGLGYANLGSLLMRMGVPYDSPEGRALAGTLTAILTGRAYATSAEMASVLGPFPRFEENRAHMLRVIRNHRRAAYDAPTSEYEGVSHKVVGIDPEIAPAELLVRAREVWDTALALGEEHGYRNAQVSVLAPTGTIGLLMDCDTTGVEPDFALVKFKKLAGGGYFKIVNRSVEPALRRLGYSENQITRIVEYVVGTNSLHRAPHINTATLVAKGFTVDDLSEIEAVLPGVFELRHAFNRWTLGDEALQRAGFSPEDYEDPSFDLLTALGFTEEQIAEANDYVCGRATIEGAPGLLDEHLPIFDTANRNGRLGRRFIHHTGHIEMMAAVQPFISGAISKTINMPNEATVDEIEESYRLSWELGLKAIALYRDGSKASQPLSASSDDGTADDEDEEVTEAVVREVLIHAGLFRPGISPTEAYRDLPRPRFLLPARRRGFTQEARVGGHKLFLRTGEYEDGTLGEVFIDLAKEGATLRGILSCFAIAVSKGLQYGVPLEEYVDTFVFQTFEPRGIVEGHPNIKMATSIIDYVFRALGVEYLQRDELAQVPPERSISDLPEPPKGVAVDAGTQLALDEAAKERDIDAQVDAARFADTSGPSMPVRTGPGTPSAAMTAGNGTPATTVVDRVAEAALGDLMGDAPVCSNCGHMTVRNGSCYVCLTCGDTTGCS